MLPHHRRRLSVTSSSENRSSRLIVRLLIGLLAFLIAWYLMTRMLAFFDYSVGMHKGALLTVRSGNNNVQVSLQGGQWQNGETGLKLDAGDAVMTRGNSDALLTFFDGTRVRLDQGSDVLVQRTDRYSEGTSALQLHVRAGRVWIATPSPVAFSGSIVRTVTTKNFTAKIPSSAHVLISSTVMTVLRASGIGLTVDVSPIKNGVQIVVGEGQFLTLTDDARSSIAAGRDPYDFRDPISPQMLKDDFLATSYALLSQNITGTNQQSTKSPAEQLTDLTLTSPDNRVHINAKTVTVSGKVSGRVALVLVNGQGVSVRKDQTFSVDMSLTREATTGLHIEAQDTQGITLESTDRIVYNDYRPVVEPARIKSPVGSGQTLITSLKEVEITGEAPANTAAILMNDYTLQLFKPGNRTWSYLASTALGNLIPGTNVFTVYALDSDGNRSPPRSISIVYTPSALSSGSGAEPPLKQNSPLTPGTLSVQAPQEGTETTTEKKAVVIEGRTSAETNSISVNGYTLSLYLPGKTTWNYIASTELQTLKRGRNVYRIVSRNANGEILDVLEYTITYKP